MLEKTEGANQRHWQHWTHKTRDEDKTNNTIQKTKRISNTNPIPGELYSIQHYVIKFVSDFQ